jgi:hypothetical protein
MFKVNGQKKAYSSLSNIRRLGLTKLSFSAIFKRFIPCWGMKFAPSLFSESPASAGGRRMNFDFPTFYRALTDLVIRISYMVVMY